MFNRLTVYEDEKNKVKIFLKDSHKEIEYLFPKYITPINRVEESNIIARQNYLIKINKLFGAGVRIIQLLGVGGIGKTTIANSFAIEYSESYNHIVCINSNYSTIKEAIINDKSLLSGLFLPIEDEELDYVYHEVIRSLFNFGGGKNLLIINDAYQYEDIEGFLRLVGEWDTILTTRVKIGNKIHSISVEKLSVEEAMYVFYSFYTREKNDIILKKLVQALDLHILSIEILAKHAQKINISIEEVYEELLSNQTSFKNASFQKNVEKIFTKLDEFERTFLLCLSMLPNKKYLQIEIQEFIDLFQNVKIPDLDKVMNNIQKHSFIQIDSSGAIMMHKMISKVIRAKYIPKINLFGLLEIGELKNSLKELVSNNKINVVFNKFNSIKLPEIYINEIILLKSRFKDLEEKSRLGVMYEKDILVVSNQIKYALLRIIDQIDDL